MPGAMKSIRIAVALLALSSTGIFGQFDRARIERGGQWLSWDPKERTAYIVGFLGGYYSGTSQLCESADELFKVRDSNRVPPDVMPGFEASALCFQSRSDYSKRFAHNGLDVSPYVNAVTEFYTKHPDYEAVPFPKLMLLLADGKCDTAEQLYQKALKGELQRVTK